MQNSPRIMGMLTPVSHLYIDSLALYPPPPPPTTTTTTTTTHTFKKQGRLWNYVRLFVRPKLSESRYSATTRPINSKSSSREPSWHADVQRDISVPICAIRAPWNSLFHMRGVLTCTCASSWSFFHWLDTIMQIYPNDLIVGVAF